MSTHKKISSISVTEDLIYKVQLAEQADRHDDMLNAIKSMVAAKANLNNEERNLFSVAYKNLVGARRYSWRVISTLEHATGITAKKHNMTKEYRETIEKELQDLCSEVIRVVDASLLPKASDVEATVFYLKLKGDYCRYLAEIATEDDRVQAVDNSRKAYQDAFELAKCAMSPTSPIRLGLSLNYSVFYYEIMDNQEEACRIAKQAFDDAIAELDTLNEESFKDSTLIMQLIRDNLTVWHTDIQEIENDETADVGDN